MTSDCNAGAVILPTELNWFYWFILNQPKMGANTYISFMTTTESRLKLSGLHKEALAVF